MNQKLTSRIEHLMTVLILGCVLLSPVAAETEPQMMPEVLITAETDAAIMMPPVIVTAPRITAATETIPPAPAEVGETPGATGGGGDGMEPTTFYRPGRIHGYVGSRYPMIYAYAPDFPTRRD